MKTVLSVLAAVVALSVASAQAEEGAVSRNALAKMGLSNLKVMSDAEGMQVRGKFVSAYSSGISNFAVLGANGSQTSTAAAQSYQYKNANVNNSNIAVGGAGFIGGFNGNIIFGANAGISYTAGSANAHVGN